MYAASLFILVEHKQFGGGRSLCFFAEGDSSSQSIPVLMQFIMWYGIQFVNNHQAQITPQWWEGGDQRLETNSA